MHGLGSAADWKLSQPPVTWEDPWEAELTLAGMKGHDSGAGDSNCPSAAALSKLTQDTAAAATH